MKSARILLPLLLVATSAFAQSQKSFDLMKSLAGTWEGKASNGQTATEIYRVASNGSVVMSELPGDNNMISMYTVDGNRLLLTHYCSMGNQPRMAGTIGADGKTLDFEFVDATNLASPDAGHIHRAVLTLVDSNHLTEDWYFMQGDKEKHEHFDLQRKPTV